GEPGEGVPGDGLAGGGDRFEGFDRLTLGEHGDRPGGGELGDQVRVLPEPADDRHGEEQVDEAHGEGEPGQGDGYSGHWNSIPIGEGARVVPEDHPLAGLRYNARGIVAGPPTRLRPGRVSRPLHGAAVRAVAARDRRRRAVAAAVGVTKPRTVGGAGA